MEKKKPKSGIDLLASNNVRLASQESLSAQNAILCYPINNYETIRWSLIAKVTADSCLCSIDRVVCLLVLRYGLRITEVLSITKRQCLGNGRLLIKGLKGSNDKVIENVDYYNQLLSFLTLFSSIGEVYSRFYYYRLFIKLGIKFENGYGKKVSVTHAGRHLYAESLAAQSVDLATISRAMGHKSSKSTENYVKQSSNQSR